MAFPQCGNKNRSDKKTKGIMSETTNPVNVTPTPCSCATPAVQPAPVAQPQPQTATAPTASAQKPAKRNARKRQQ
jgi:hypothetical protein